MTPTDIKVNLYNSIREANEPREYTHFHASEIASCPRSQYFKRVGVPPINELTGAKLMRFQAGHILEGFIRPHLQKQFPELVSNIRLTSDELDLTGEYDNFDHVTKSLIEIKSVHPWAFKYLVKEGKPYLAHEYQQHAYKLLFKEEEAVELQHIFYIYIALDGQIEVFKTEPNEKIESNVRKRVKVLKEAWEKQEPPVCLCEESHPLYKGSMAFCDYKEGSVCCDLSLINTIKGEKT